MDWQNVLGVAATIFALASAAGLGLMRGTLGNLRASNDDLRARVSDLEAERERNQIEKTEMRAEITRLQDHEGYLQTMIQGRVEWTAISDQLEEVHRLTVRIDKNTGGKG
jgi:hypothetical protein